MNLEQLRAGVRKAMAAREAKKLDCSVCGKRTDASLLPYGYRNAGAPVCSDRGEGSECWAKLSAEEIDNAIEARRAAAKPELERNPAFYVGARVLHRDLGFSGTVKELFPETGDVTVVFDQGDSICTCWSRFEQLALRDSTPDANPLKGDPQHIGPITETPFMRMLPKEPKPDPDAREELYGLQPTTGERLKGRRIPEPKPDPYAKCRERDRAPLLSARASLGNLWDACGELHEAVTGGSWDGLDMTDLKDAEESQSLRDVAATMRPLLAEIEALLRRLDG